MAERKRSRGRVDMADEDSYGTTSSSTHVREAMRLAKAKKERGLTTHEADARRGILATIITRALRDKARRVRGAPVVPEHPEAWGSWRPSHVVTDRAPPVARVLELDDGIFAEGQLSGEQAQALRLVEAGLNVFVTGPGGTGKSKLIDILRGLRGVVVTASTGIAALNVGGITLHRFAGLGLAQQPTDVIIRMLQRSPKGAEDPRIAPWLNVHTLIVDEAPMLTEDYLRKLDSVARFVRTHWPVADGCGRGTTEPFGGVHLVFLGDFAQLTASETSILADSERWAAWFPYTVSLETIFRQKDMAFVQALNRLRLGSVLDADLALFNACAASGEREGDADPYTDHLELFPYRKMVAQHNLKLLERCPGPDAVFTTAFYVHRFGGGRVLPGTPAYAALLRAKRTALRSRARADVVRAAASDGSASGSTMDAPIALTRRLEEGARLDGVALGEVAAGGSNVFDRFEDTRLDGTSGKDSNTLMRCADDDSGRHRPAVSTDDLVKAVRATSTIHVHPSDATMQVAVDASIVDMSIVPELRLRMGATVLLTRNVNQERGLVNGSLGRVIGFTTSRTVLVAAADPDPTDPADASPTDGDADASPALVATAMDGVRRVPFVRDSGAGGWPVVQFACGPTVVHPTSVLVPVFAVAEGEGGARVTYGLEVETVPLLCAWAVSVHRAQGMTLDRIVAHVDLMRRPSQVYTALSRVRSLRGLRIRGEVALDNAIAHRRAVLYYRALAALRAEQGTLCVVRSTDLHSLVVRILSERA